MLTTNRAIASVFLVLSLAGFKCHAVEPAKFKEHLLADDLVSGYQVEVADINHDGIPDLLAVDSRAEELLWFEGPDWNRQVLSEGMTRMIYMGVCDGHYVVAQKFSNRVKDSIGEIVVIAENGSKKIIDKIPTSHRIRCADINGSGNEVVINAPLTGLDALAPDYRDNVPLVYYKPGDWQRQVISDENEGVVHGIYIYDWDGDGRDDVMTASFSGIHVHSFDNGWQRTEITRGYPGEWPQAGSSDLAVGNAGSRYV
ncbi:MAG: VCBS repeat-containing protein, partial [Gammaproteobacteria bacterium]|nr:VCBS repeat-containing protein [Gammaproteobacteria bacterium]